VARGTLRVGVICTGNICRSPMAEVVLKHLVARDSTLDGHVIVTSAGTANWHVGDPMDSRARAALDRAGYRFAGSPAAFADRRYLDAQDIVVVMTREHLAEVKVRLRSDHTEVLLWRTLLDPGTELDVADPYYGDDQAFDECLAVLSSGGQRLIEEFRQRLDARSYEA
jgi:protein-tyrosine phosphatase